MLAQVVVILMFRLKQEFQNDLLNFVYAYICTFFYNEFLL